MLLCLGVLICGLLLHKQYPKPDHGRFRKAALSDSPASAGLPAPRLARIPAADAVSNAVAAASPNREAVSDADRPLLDEQALMQQIRDSLTTNPRLAEILAREGRQRFPDSPDSDERDMLLVGALFNQGRLDRARIEARSYFARHPAGRFTRDLIALTGARPR